MGSRSLFSPMPGTLRPQSPREPRAAWKPAQLRQNQAQTRAFYRRFDAGKKSEVLIFGIGSGAAMIPYSVMKEVNPDKAKGSATGGINFLVFGITAAMGPIYAQLIGKILGTPDRIVHLREGGAFWIACSVAAIVVSLFLRETGHSAQHQAPRG